MTQHQMVGIKNGSKLRHTDGYYIEYYRVVATRQNKFHLMNEDKKRDIGDDTISHEELNSSDWSLEE